MLIGIGKNRTKLSLGNKELTGIKRIQVGVIKSLKTDDSKK
jgi:hypothetical protein